MFEIDDKMLDDLGVGALQGKEREEFKAYVKNTLQDRVGKKLTDGMDDSVLDEFGYFMDGNVDGMKQWLAAHVPDYESDPNFVRLKQNNPDADEGDVLAAYGQLAWLQVNCPNYPEIVSQTLDEIKHEIADNREAILGA